MYNYAQGHTDLAVAGLLALGAGFEYVGDSAPDDEPPPIDVLVDCRGRPDAAGARGASEPINFLCTYTGTTQKTA